MSNLSKIKFLIGTLALALMVSVASVASAAYMHTGLLKMGMTSSNVMSLQQTLNAGGFLVATTGAGSPGMESMYFGAKTKAAVMAFQSAKGLTADGVVGAQTGTALAAMTGGSVALPAGCMSTSGYSTTTGMPCTSGANTNLPAGCMSTSGYSSTTGMSCSGGSSSNGGSLSGGETDISDVNVDEADDDTLNEGSNKAPVAQISFDVDDADARLVRADVVFQAADGNSDEDKPWRVFDKVYLMDGSTTVASVTADDEDAWDDADTDESGDVLPGSNFNGGSNDAYRIRFNNINKTYNEGSSPELWVAVDVSSSVDGADSGVDWGVGLGNDGLRFVDGAGLDTLAESSDVAEFTIQESGADSEFSVTEDSSSPSATSLEVKTNTSSTQTIAVFKMKADEDGGDVKLNDFPVTLNGSANLSTFIDDVMVTIDGTEYKADGSVDTATHQTFTFDDIEDDDIVIDAGDDMTVTVKVKFKSQGNNQANYNNGVTVYAVSAVTSSDVEDADSGDDVSDVNGASTADTFALFSDGIAAELTGGTTPSVTEDDSGSNTKLTYNMTFKVTAFGSDVYIPRTVAETSSSSAGLIYEIETSAGNVDTTETDATNGSLQSSADEISGYYRVEEGETETFTVTISTVLNSSSPTPGFYHVQLNAIQFSTTNQDGSPESSYTLSPENDFDGNDGQLDAVIS